jgi:hypothetical protein
MFTHFFPVVLGQLDLLNTIICQPGMHSFDSNGRVGSQAILL